MVTRDEVLYAFRLLLGREPESVTVIDQFLTVPHWANLREIFFASEEFKAKLNVGPSSDSLASFINAPPNFVEVEISTTHFDRLVAHVQASWEALGRTRPHWSVLTDPIFLPGKIDDNVTNFYKTGEYSMEVLENAAARAGKQLSPNWTCLELGCGVGRVTAHLARRFKQVIAADISLPHLELARAHLRNECVENVALVQMKSLATLECQGAFDIFYSIIVFQHNPPPLIYRMLQIIFDKVRVGGCVYFQLPVAYPNYGFSIDEYIKSIEKGAKMMEMHVLPQTYLFRVLEDHGFRILDFQRDNWTGPAFHSVTVFAEKIR
jgi:SAM-dependent methyltransferase